jgi:hypothetical protein
VHRIFLTPLWLGEFIDDERVVETQTGRYSAEDQLNSLRGGWDGLLESLEERYAVGSRTAHEGSSSDERHPKSIPAIAAAIDDITHEPTDHDYPLWRVRCEVNSHQ